MASPVDTSVKFYRDDFPGAPVLNGVAGSAISTLDACLVSGFGQRTVTSLVVAGGVATATLASDPKNGNLLHSVVLVEGVTGALGDLNGEQRITSASSTALQWATALADGTAAGTITVKTAPAGWEKRFSGTNKAAYRSLAPEAYGAHLWVNDVGTTICNVRGFVEMTDVDTGAGPFPTTVDSAAGGFWTKSSSANATAIRWDIFADARIFYYCPVSGSGANPTQIGQAQYAFGDAERFKSTDPFASILTASTATTSTAANYGSVLYNGQGGGGAHISRWARSYTGLGAAVSAFCTSYVGTNSSPSGNDTLQGQFPAPTDGGLRVSKVYATETAQIGATAVLRGEMPGAYFSPQSGLYQSFQRGDTVPFGAKKLYAVYVGTSFSDTPASTNAGRGFFDITGPWR